MQDNASGKNAVTGGPGTEKAGKKVREVQTKNPFGGTEPTRVGKGLHSADHEGNHRFYVETQETKKVKREGLSIKWPLFDRIEKKKGVRYEYQSEGGGPEKTAIRQSGGGERGGQPEQHKIIVKNQRKKKFEHEGGMKRSRKISKMQSHASISAREKGTLSTVQVKDRKELKWGAGPLRRKIRSEYLNEGSERYEPPGRAFGKRTIRSSNHRSRTGSLRPEGKDVREDSTTDIKTRKKRSSASGPTFYKTCRLGGGGRRRDD